MESRSANPHSPGSAGFPWRRPLGAYIARTRPTGTHSAVLRSSEEELMGSRCTFALLVLSSLPLLAGCRESASAAEPQKESGVAWLTQEQIRTQQIEVAPLGQHAVDETVATTGRVTFDDLRVAHVYSPVTGRVASVDAALGQRLKKG